MTLPFGGLRHENSHIHDEHTRRVLSSCRPTLRRMQSLAAGEVLANTLTGGSEDRGPNVCPMGVTVWRIRSDEATRLREQAEPPAYWENFAVRRPRTTSSLSSSPKRMQTGLGWWERASRRINRPSRGSSRCGFVPTVDDQVSGRHWLMPSSRGHAVTALLRYICGSPARTNPRDPSTCDRDSQKLGQRGRSRRIPRSQSCLWQGTCELRAFAGSCVTLCPR